MEASSVKENTSYAVDSFDYCYFSAGEGGSYCGDFLGLADRLLDGEMDGFLRGLCLLVGELCDNLFRSGERLDLRFLSADGCLLFSIIFL